MAFPSAIRCSTLGPKARSSDFEFPVSFRPPRAAAFLSLAFICATFSTERYQWDYRGCLGARRIIFRSTDGWTVGELTDAAILQIRGSVPRITTSWAKAREKHSGKSAGAARSRRSDFAKRFADCSPPEFRKIARPSFPLCLQLNQNLTEGFPVIRAVPIGLPQPGTLVPHSYKAAKTWKLQYPTKTPIAEPASTSLRKCMPRIIRENAMSSATASNTTCKSG